tara:strand:+ start:639 stop:1808 length:1170 start_codon:yes stop_codon:yes gene_type:complete
VTLNKKIKKICVVVNSRANYGRIKSLLTHINSNKKLKLILVVGASATLFRFGEVDKVIKKDQFKIDEKLFSIVEGDNLITMSKSIGLSIIELSNVIEKQKPDMVIAIADRYENLSVAIAGSYMNIPVAHVQGGETTGSIDEKVRHAITKLSDAHFVSTKRSKKFVINMGEMKSCVYHTGCPSIDLALLKDYSLEKNFFNKNGTGANFSSSEKYILVLQHPVTTEYKNANFQIDQTIEAVEKFHAKTKYKVIWLWPNIDAGSDVFSKKIRFLKEKKTNYIRFVKNFTPENYVRVLKNSSCIVGNSSSGIREASFLGTPTVNIGTRQSDRERAPNVIDVGYNSNKIYKSILNQIDKNYKRSFIYGDGKAGKKIADIISKTDFKTTKKLNYL